jgi:hypothetical protein
MKKARKSARKPSLNATGAGGHGRMERAASRACICTRSASPAADFRKSQSIASTWSQDTPYTFTSTAWRGGRRKASRPRRQAVIFNLYHEFRGICGTPVMRIPRPSRREDHRGLDRGAVPALRGVRRPGGHRRVRQEIAGLSDRVALWDRPRFSSTAARSSPVATGPEGGISSACFESRRAAGTREISDRERRRSRPAQFPGPFVLRQTLPTPCPPRSRRGHEPLTTAERKRGVRGEDARLPRRPARRCNLIRRGVRPSDSCRDRRRS